MIFIIGAPRSGTKLLRGLLNGHSKIYIPEVETLFLYDIYSRWGNFGNIANKDNFKKLYSFIISTPFYSYLEDAKEEYIVDFDYWFDSITNASYGHVMSKFFESCAHKKGKIIFGDKTPSYIYPVSFIREQFPGARIIHLVRDPRDYVLSAQKAWGKNIFRSAHRWNLWIKSAVQNLKLREDDNILVKYESLLQNPEIEIERITTFLDVSYEPEMLNLVKTVENLGDAKGLKGIVKVNFRKWKDRLNPSQIRCIEELCFDSLNILNYDIEFGKKSTVLNKFKLTFFKTCDAYNLLKSHYKMHGIRGVKRQLKSVIIS